MLSHILKKSFIPTDKIWTYRDIMWLQVSKNTHVVNETSRKMLWKCDLNKTDNQSTRNKVFFFFILISYMTVYTRHNVKQQPFLVSWLNAL